ncbi:hypothetical protein GCM10025876_16180 [Demequina litorisediminis]|uniref:Uncharacterized protein n=2 Tax=Demequina TaxID=577469 RepID=A0ABQ6IF99_9MICO|nr:hypothetical protein GCM10025876_16180 [Demequina litorisediminis]
MATLNNGLQLMGVGSDMTQIIKGLVLLAAVAFDVYNKTQGRPSLIGAMGRAFQNSRLGSHEPVVAPAGGSAAASTIGAHETGSTATLPASATSTATEAPPVVDDITQTSHPMGNAEEER